MRRELSGCKCRLKKNLNRFKTHIFRPRQLLVAESHRKNDLYDASDYFSYHYDACLSGMNSAPIRLSRFKRTRHIVLRDFNDNEEPCYEKAYYYDVTDQASRMLFMLHGGKL